jgi:hypothetical protein
VMRARKRGRGNMLVRVGGFDGRKSVLRKIQQ